MPLRWLLTLAALAAGGAGLFWLSSDDDAPPRRRPQDPGVQGRSRPIPRDRPTLRVTDGVAVAPDFDKQHTRAKTDDAQAPEKGEHFFVGRAIYRGTSEPVIGAAVVLEEVGGGDSSDPTRAWAQPQTDRRGVLHVRMPADAKSPLRVVVRGPRDAIGITPARPGTKPVTNLGVIRVGGAEVLTGFVYGAAGAPAAHHAVRAYRFALGRILDGVVARAASDERGWFELKDLPTGLYLLRSEDADGRRYLRFPIVVPAADPIELRPTTAARLAATVRDTAGRPSSAARVEAWPVRPSTKSPLERAHYLEPWFTETDAKGRAVFPHLPLAEFTLHVTLADKAPFEFHHDHTRRTDRTLRVATRTRITYGFFKAMPPRMPVPIPDTKLKLVVEGKGTVSRYDQSRTLTVTTDEAGVATLPRFGAREQFLKAIWIDDDREGASTIQFNKTLETATPWAVMLKPRPPRASPPPKPNKSKGASPMASVRRSIKVVTESGLPVRGALIYAAPGGGPRVATNAEGIAVVKLSPDSAVRLYRPDLASGDPESDGETLVWAKGELVALVVTDDVDGFAIVDARVGPRRRAWRRIGPGVFETLWGESDSLITATARGYEVWEHAAPPDGGTLEAKLRAPAEPPTAMLLVEVTRANRPAAAAVVSGSWRSGNEEGKGHFTALTGPQGRALVPDLREGEWTLRGNTVDGATGKAPVRLARGLNPVALALDENLPIAGKVRDDKGRPIVGAEVRILVSTVRGVNARTEPTPARAVTGDDGTFMLRVSPRSKTITLRAHAPGHAETSVSLRKGDLKKAVVITMPRAASLELSVAWEDGGSDPLPPDASVNLTVRTFPGRGKRRTWRDRRWKPLGRFVVRDAKILVPDVPPGRVTWGGPAVKPGAVTVWPGRASDGSIVLLRRGGIVEGMVIREKRGVPFETVHLVGRAKLTVVTDKDGAFERQNVPPGRYKIAHPYQHPGSARANKNVVVTAGTVAKVRIELRK